MNLHYAVLMFISEHRKSACIVVILFLLYKINSSDLHNLVSIRELYRSRRVWGILGFLQYKTISVADFQSLLKEFQNKVLVYTEKFHFSIPSRIL